MIKVISMDYHPLFVCEDLFRCTGHHKIFTGCCVELKSYITGDIFVDVAVIFNLILKTLYLNFANKYN